MFVIVGGRAGVDDPDVFSTAVRVDDGAADDSEGAEDEAAATAPRSQGFGGEPIAAGGGRGRCGR